MQHVFLFCTKPTWHKHSSSWPKVIKVRENVGGNAAVWAVIASNGKTYNSKRVGRPYSSLRVRVLSLENGWKSLTERLSVYACRCERVCCFVFSESQVCVQSSCEMCAALSLVCNLPPLLPLNVELHSLCALKCTNACVEQDGEEDLKKRGENVSLLLW